MHVCVAVYLMVCFGVVVFVCDDQIILFRTLHVFLLSFAGDLSDKDITS